MFRFSSIPKPKLLIAPLLLLTLSLGACGNNTTTTTPGGGTTAPAGGGGTVSMTGAGATFPAPLYQRWFFEYNRANPNVQIAYQSVGSGAGIQQFTQGTVDFGASDVAMSDEQLAEVSRGVVLLPVTAGSIVISYNLDGVEDLKLSREALAGIFLGTITKWNDPLITADNPGVNLPDQDISVVFRSDGSGTTGVFTKYMEAMSPEWAQRVGQGTAVEFPVGVGGRGNEGVTQLLTSTSGSISYIEFGFAEQQNIPVAALENKAGNFIVPTAESSAATLASVELPENLRAFIVDPEGDESYSIVTYTWILAYKTGNDPAKLEAFKRVLNWTLDDEQQAVAKELGYIPLPPEVVTKVRAAIDTLE